mgnify:CR=1 FL=1
MPVSAAAAVVSAIVNSVANAVSDLPPAQPVPVYVSMARSFPLDARKGELTPPLLPTLQINGNTLPPAPGLQVRNQQNLIVMPASIQETVPVRYQLDPLGNVWRIWILSAAEVAAPDPVK